MEEERRGWEGQGGSGMGEEQKGLKQLAFRFNIFTERTVARKVSCPWL